MNRNLALALVNACMATGTAFANDITVNSHPFVFTFTPAQVKEELNQLRQGGVNPLSPGHSAWPGIALSRLTTLSGAVWGSVLAALFLLISPSLRSYWALGRDEPPFERLTFFRTMLVISGRLVIARLAAVPGIGRRSPASPGTRSDHAQGCGAREGTQRCLRGRVRRPRSSIGWGRRVRWSSASRR